MTLQWHFNCSLSKKLTRIVSALLAFAFLGLEASSLSAASVFDAIGQEVNSIFEKSKPAIVRVRSEGDELTMAGTGFFIDDKGTLLTAAPILGENVQASVEVNGIWLNAKILGRDMRSGVALLQVPQGFTPFVTIGNSSSLKSGLAVLSIGYPRNLPVAPSFGFISGFDFRYLDRYFPTTHIRANLPVAPGQVGGPLFNTKGEVVGLLVTAVDEGRSVYALPIEAAFKVIDDFKKYGTARHGWVGVGVKELDNSGSGLRAVEISQLFEDTPASQSGLQKGDRVLRIGDRPITCPADVMNASFFSQVGKETAVTVERGGKTFVYKFVVQERPTAMPTLLQERRSMLTTPAAAPKPATGISVKASAGQ